MTREEAIARIKEHKDIHKMNEPRAILISKALDMAINSLEQKPKEKIGKWEILPKSKFDSSTNDHIRCTNCSKEPFGDIPYMFCPNCGARMGSEE